jgi:hypothetical protein
MAGNEDPRIKLLLDNIQPYPDFPKPGIVFQDIFGAMRKAPVLKCLMELTQEHAKKLEGKVDCVVGLDSRGFLFGPTMALELGVPFVPVSFEKKSLKVLPTYVLYIPNYSTLKHLPIFGNSRLGRKVNCLEIVRWHHMIWSMEVPVLNCRRMPLNFVTQTKTKNQEF